MYTTTHRLSIMFIFIIIIYSIESLYPISNLKKYVFELLPDLIKGNCSFLFTIQSLYFYVLFYQILNKCLRIDLDLDNNNIHEF